MDRGEPITDAADLRQGDIVDLSWIPAVVDGGPGKRWTPCGVAIISQTCDVVNSGPSKSHVTVAPVLSDPTPGVLSAARKGGAPLSLHLAEPGAEVGVGVVADLQLATSVPKEMLLGRTLLQRHASEDASPQARDIAEKVGRAYSRFAFPDEVVSVLRKMKNKARQAAQGQGGLGRVLEHVEFRISANHWNLPGRELKLYVIVEPSLLIVEEDADPDWKITSASVVGMKPKERLSDVSFSRLSEILADTCDSYLVNPTSSDGTTLLRLWERWADQLKIELLDPQVDSEVVRFQLELLSHEEIAVSRWRETASLDLEDLSERTLATYPLGPAQTDPA